MLSVIKKFKQISLLSLGVFISRRLGLGVGLGVGLCFLTQATYVMEYPSRNLTSSTVLAWLLS